MTTDASPPPTALAGADLIRDVARRAPDKPGVYRMYGEDGGCLYVGKARSLKKRVMQYAQGRFHTNRIGLMVSLTRSMELVTTASETEALLLEGGYIKKLPDDPWGNAYLYASPGKHGAFDVWTNGADGKEGGEGINADIGSWQ